MSALPPRLAAFHAAGRDRYGVVTAAGIVDLTDSFPYAGLKAAVEAGALTGSGRCAESAPLVSRASCAPSGTCRDRP